MDPVDFWHRCVETNDFNPIESILDDNATFYSPAVHSPKNGKAEVAKYLRTAMAILNNGSFNYTREWRSERSAVLEFSAVVDGIHFNGVDIIKWNENDLIEEFKVMVRPLKALNLIVPLMGKALGVAK